MFRLHPTVALLALVVVGCTGSEPKTAEGAGGDGKGKASGSELTALKTEDTKVGTGAPVKANDKVFVRYRGYFKDGREFDSNMVGGKPIFDFVAGPTGGVIEGWQKGVIGMKQGGTRKLSVPWKMAYGEQGNDSIPGKSDLYFDIEVKSILRPEDQDVVKRKNVKMGTGPGLKEGDKATVKVVGTILDGDIVDKSDKFTFTVGKGEVIPGIDAGIVGMKVGGVRELTVPPNLAFGPSGRPPAIPGTAVLKYTLTLIKIG
ncbi:FKBP-type peptidyl-prolyl cis-trans isomerase [bacterium]|nr:MAG: FKBP-type peptidyl-prolyl cis-trans isomerase [bacterium]